MYSAQLKEDAETFLSEAFRQAHTPAFGADREHFDTLIDAAMHVLSDLPWNGLPEDDYYEDVEDEE